MHVDHKSVLLTYSFVPRISPQVNVNSVKTGIVSILFTIISPNVWNRAIAVTSAKLC